MRKSVLFKGGATLTGLQYLVWAAVLLIGFFAMISDDGVKKSAAYAVNNTCFYALIVYGNIRFLYPWMYQKKRYLLYAVASTVLLLLAGAGRSYISSVIHNKPAASGWQDPATWITFFLSGITVFVLSFVFRLAIAYFLVKKASEEALLQRSQFELKLLRSQVQPHFLFNTLNNMYYEAYLDSPRTALLIERLSEIMRYFVDQSSRDTVALSTEVEFLDNYIQLEKIRIQPEPDISFEKRFDAGTVVPPMLLMTFVENIFKHGIDKISGVNTITLSLIHEGGYLYFRTKNGINKHAEQPTPNGLGLQNLRQRLAILYHENFQLDTGSDGRHFSAFLKIPLDEPAMHGR